MTGTRVDIQALRGIAVLLVVAYHFAIPPFSGGYLGVDVFFVISGYLITGMVMRDLQAGQFSFSRFYARRALRLLPAAYVVMGVILVLAPFVLTGATQADVARQILWAVPLAANIGLWLQTGYFEQAGMLKPLLHFWSLAIEEQYYLLLPFGLWLVPRRFWFAALAVATVASLVLCLLFVTSKPGATFYLLPTRLWELGLGSLLAAATMWRGNRDTTASIVPVVAAAIGVASIAALAFVVIYPGTRPHPSFAALAACVATACLIAVAPRLLSQGIGARCLAWTGDRSYSLYLVHWPVAAILNNANVGGANPPWSVRLAGAMLSLLLAVALYEGVERRYRLRGNATAPRGRLLFLAVGAIVLGLAALALNASSSTTASVADRLRANVGLHPNCDQSREYRRLPECQTTDSARTVLWGDSFAMHWAEGLKTQQIDFVQATRATCAPLLDRALLRDQFTEQWGRDCIAFNRAIVDDIVARGATTVLLASAWLYLIDVQNAVVSDGRTTIEIATQERLGDSIAATIRSLRSKGLKVVVLLPPPSAEFDIGRCQERRLAGLIAYGGSADCNIPRQTFAQGHGRKLEWLRSLAARESATVIDPSTVLCVDGSCKTKDGDVLIYRDSGHLSYEGSRWLAQVLQFKARVDQPAAPSK